MAGLRVKKIICCLLIAAVTAAITNCGATLNSNTNPPTTTLATPIPTASLEPTASADNHPLESPSASPALTSQPTAGADSVMINEQKYFKFGMSGKSIEKEMKNLGIKVTDESSSPDDAPAGFSSIGTDNISFYLNDQDQLYSITVYSGETVKGLKIGDPVEKIQQLYGKPDEADDIYYCNGYVFSVYTDSKTETVFGWCVFLNIWNDPDSYGITNAMYVSDASIQFDEKNFRNLFTFGISRKELKKKLTRLGIRIDSEAQFPDDYGWGVDTDHLHFMFDIKQHLYYVVVWGWETAKGLKIGDSVEQLHRLYGKENKSSKDDGFFTYNMKGYKFDVDFSDGVDLGLTSWSIYVKNP